MTGLALNGLAPNGLALNGLDVGYRRRVVLAGLRAEAARGEVTALVGPNGAGKSTLLRTVAGLQQALAGTVTVDGVDLLTVPAKVRARRLAVVLTERVEPGLLTARELAGLGRHPHTGPGGGLGPADLAVVDAALAAVDATGLAGRPAAELSDGELQRVLLARALAQEPDVLLLDEPTAFLDVAARVSVFGLLRGLARDRDLCVLVSTHDLELVLRLADRVWLLDRDGALHAGSPEQLVAVGVVAATFDTDRLALDPATGTFALRPGDGPRVRLRGGPELTGPAARLLARAGWTPHDGEDPVADIELGPDGFRVHHRGRIVELPDWAELARWARSEAPAERAAPSR